jgi:uncharacterized protein (DUF952 family)/quercetin dioxygenase-like cupin family protein
VSVAKVNIRSVELDEPLDEAGFRHVATSVGRRLGAKRIGAGLYDAHPGFPIWPYHYHHGIEEWLYVVSGAPVLRDPAGKRTLAAGDVVCFPSGRDGAHTLEGPGRFVIFDAGRDREPFMSVYPDSDKASGPEGILLRSSAVGYWYGEGSAGTAQPALPRPEPPPSPPRPVVNVATAGAQRLGPLLGAERLEAALLELAPGQGSVLPAGESWLLVLEGAPTLRGEDGLREGDLACLPEGAARLVNRTEGVVRALALSTRDGDREAAIDGPVIFHITTRSAWEAARASGRYEAPSLAAEGFIHLSDLDQVAGVAEARFSGEDDIVVLCAAADRLEAPLIYETSDAGEETFPHLYGPLNLDAVLAVTPLSPRRSP